MTNHTERLKRELELECSISTTIKANDVHNVCMLFELGLAKENLHKYMVTADGAVT